MPGYQASSFLRRASAANANLIRCHLKENVDVIPSFFLYGNFVFVTFAQFIAKIPVLYLEKIRKECGFGELTEK